MYPYNFFFRLFFPSGVATADFPSPVAPIFCILLRHFNLSHVLFHHIHKPRFWPSRQLHPQHPSPNIPIIFPQYMSIPPQSRISCFLSKPSHLCSCPSDVFIPDLCPFLSLLMKILTSSTLPPPSPPPVFSSVPPSPPVQHCWYVSLPPYTFPFTLAGTRISQITPDILLQPFHPACTLFFTSLPHSPLLCTVEPRYLKSSTFATSSPCIFTVPLTCLSFTHTCILSFYYCLSFHFSPKRISSSPASLLPVPCSRCRSQCHLQTSWSMELPL